VTARLDRFYSCALRNHAVGPCSRCDSETAELSIWPDGSASLFCYACHRFEPVRVVRAVNLEGSAAEAFNAVARFEVVDELLARRRKAGAPDVMLGAEWIRNERGRLVPGGPDSWPPRPFYVQRGDDGARFYYESERAARASMQWPGPAVDVTPVRGHAERIARARRAVLQAESAPGSERPRRAERDR